MAAYAIIENGVVANIIEADSATAAKLGAVLAGEAARGYAYVDGIFSKPARPVGEIEAEAKRAKQQAAAVEIKQDARVLELLNMTPSEVRTWVKNTSTEEVLATLAATVSVLAGRL